MEIDVRKGSVKCLKDLARDCYDSRDQEPGHRQGEMNSTKYCKWLWYHTVLENNHRGDVICPFVDMSVIVHGKDFMHPGCKYLKPEE
jgi:hypothetical protein